MHYPLKPPVKKWTKTVAAPCAACIVREKVFCTVLSDPELQEMAKFTVNVSMPARQTILNEGDPSTLFYNVTAGVLKIFKQLPDGRQQITGFLYPGDFLGIARSKHYAYSAESITDVRLCRFKNSELEHMFKKVPSLESWMLDTASNELIQAQDQLLLLGRKTAIERLCSFLLSVCSRASIIRAESNVIHLPMGRESIADYLGLTTETISRTFSKLKKSGVILSTGKGSIEIADMQAIRKMATGS
jgi:CRP/FNR family transcriptional regulator